jgi:hypothetical protein
MYENRGGTGRRYEEVGLGAMGRIPDLPGVRPSSPTPCREDDAWYRCNVSFWCSFNAMQSRRAVEPYPASS